MSRTRHSASDDATPGSTGFQAQTERIAREFGESAQQVWLAGIGALSRAQAEGSRLFEQLAEEGRAVDSTRSGAVHGATARLDSLRRSLDSAIGSAQTRAGDAWESVGRAFEQRVQQTLRSLDVPSREDIDALGARIDALTVELRRRSSARPSAAPAEAPTPRPRARPARPRGSASDPAGGVD